MKKAIIVLIVIAAGIVLSSCNKKVCPAYTQNDTVQTENAA